MENLAKQLPSLGILRLLLAGFLVLGLSAAAAGEPRRAVPKSQVEIKQSFAPVVKRAAPAVVNVYVRHRVKRLVSPFANDPFFSRLFGDRWFARFARLSRFS